jgi:hypothetical protein
LPPAVSEAVKGLERPAPLQSNSKLLVSFVGDLVGHILNRRLRFADLLLGLALDLLRQALDLHLFVADHLSNPFLDLATGLIG